MQGIKKKVFLGQKEGILETGLTINSGYDSDSETSIRYYIHFLTGNCFLLFLHFFLLHGLFQLKKKSGTCPRIVPRLKGK